MQTGELLGAGLVAYMFYRLTTMEVKNQGSLMEEPASKDEPQAVTEPANGEDKLYADADGVKSRSPDDVCQVKPPEMLSTSLLPNTTDKMSDDDFVTITPDKLSNINFLNSGWALGRDTTANTMRNASYDLRSEPANPKLLNLENNSFANSTIEYQAKRAFEPESPDAALDTKLGSE